MPDIAQAVIPVAGAGTRMLAAARSVPKALLPIFDRPLVQRAAEEAAEAGVREIILVVAPGQEAWFRAQFAAPSTEARRADGTLEDLTRLIERASVRFVVQEHARGLADASACAQPALDARPFLVLLPDSVFIGPTVSLALAAAAERHGASAVGVVEVPDDAVGRYGIVDGERLDERTVRLRRIVEKPRRPEDAPTRLGIAGRYVLAPEILDVIAHTPPSAVSGERELSDAIVALAATQPVVAPIVEAAQFDAGTPASLLIASAALALRESGDAAAVEAALRALLRNGVR